MNAYTPPLFKQILPGNNNPLSIVTLVIILIAFETVRIMYLGL